jgi:hypothetical protein
MLGLLPTTIDRNYATDDMIAAALAAHFGFQSVVFGTARGNTSTVPGTATLADIWGDDVWVGYVPMAEGGTLAPVGSASPDGSGDMLSLTPSATAHVQSMPWTVDEYEERNRRAWAMQVEVHETEFAYQTQLGCLITDTVT